MEENIKKLEELVSRTYKFNEDSEKALVEFVNDTGGMIITDCKSRAKYGADSLYGYIYNESSDTMEEVFIIAVFTHKDELYIKVSASELVYINDINSINIDNDDVYLVNGGEVLMNATYHNLCDILPQYIGE